MSPLKFTTVLILAVLGSVDVFGQMSGRDFENLIKMAGSLVKETNYELSIEDFDPVTYRKEIESGLWEIGIQGWAPNHTSDDKVYLLKGKAFVKNIDSGFEFSATSPPVLPFLLEDVMNAKHTRSGQDWLKKELKMSTVEFGTKKSSMTIKASGQYSDNKQVRIATDIANLIQLSRGTLNIATNYAVNVVGKDKLKEIKKTEIKAMPKGMLPFLLEDTSLDGYASKLDGVPNGYWNFSDTELGIGFYLYNKNNRLEYLLARTIDASTGKSKREKLLKGMEKFIAKNPVKGATKTEPALWNDQYYGVLVTFNYDGTVKGSDIYDAYWDIWLRYKKKLAKAIGSSL